MPESLSVAASRAKVKHSAESILFGIDFTKLLVSGETLSGTPTVAGSPSGLTIGSPAINASAPFENDEGGTVAAGKGVQVRLSGGASGTDYTLTVTSATSAGNTRVGVCTLQVRDA
jgi:hypothetical protein